MRPYKKMEKPINAGIYKVFFCCGMDAAML